MELEFEVMPTGVAVPFFVAVFANVYIRLDKDRTISSSPSSLIWLLHILTSICHCQKQPYILRLIKRQINIIIIYVFIIIINKLGPFQQFVPVGVKKMFENDDDDFVLSPK